MLYHNSWGKSLYDLSKSLETILVPIQLPLLLLDQQKWPRWPCPVGRPHRTWYFHVLRERVTGSVGGPGNLREGKGVEGWGDSPRCYTIYRYTKLYQAVPGRWEEMYNFNISKQNPVDDFIWKSGHNDLEKWISHSKEGWSWCCTECLGCEGIFKNRPCIFLLENSPRQSLAQLCLQSLFLFWCFLIVYHYPPVN